MKWLELFCDWHLIGDPSKVSEVSPRPAEGGGGRQRAGDGMEGGRRITGRGRNGRDPGREVAAIISIIENTGRAGGEGGEGHGLGWRAPLSVPFSLVGDPAALSPPPGILPLLSACLPLHLPLRHSKLTSG